MIKKNVIIVNFNSLYKILDEIKENLSFNIIEHESIENLIKDNKVDIKDYLIITKEHYKKLNIKNLLVFNDLPLSLNKLVESINVFVPDTLKSVDVKSVNVLSTSILPLMSNGVLNMFVVALEVNVTAVASISTAVLLAFKTPALMSIVAASILTLDVMFSSPFSTLKGSLEKRSFCQG